jgi:hypothetical protein
LPRVLESCIEYSITFFSLARTDNCPFTNSCKSQGKLRAGVHTCIKIDYYFPPPFQSSHRVRALSGSLPALSQGQDHVQDNIIVPGLMDPAVSFRSYRTDIFGPTCSRYSPSFEARISRVTVIKPSPRRAEPVYSIGGCQDTTITFNTALPEVFTRAQVSMHRPKSSHTRQFLIITEKGITSTKR